MVNRLTLHLLVVDKSLKDNVYKIKESREILRHRVTNEWYSENGVSLCPWDDALFFSCMAGVKEKEMTVPHPLQIPSLRADVSVLVAGGAEVTDKASRDSEGEA